MRTSRWLLVLLAVWLGAAGAWAQGLSIEGGLTHENTMMAGETAEGSIVLRNGGTRPGTVKAYQTDYLYSADGKTLYGAPGSAPRSNAKWLTFSPHEAVVPPGGSATVTYSVQAPADPTLVGTYWSLLMLEIVPDSALAPPEVSGANRGVSVRQIMRYGVQIVTHIGTGARADLKFADRQLLKDKDGGYFLRLDLENTGERWLRPTSWVEVFEATGQRLGRCEGRTVRLYPGCSARVELKLPSLSPGNYRALVVADNGDENVFGAQYDLIIK